MKNTNFKNWWYYHKWYVIAGVVLVGILIDLIGNRLHLWSPVPDYQIAYVGAPLPDDTVAALETAFEAVSKDMNGDGRVLVQINQYLTKTTEADTDAANAQTAAEVKLIGDITDCDSYFFVTDDPAQLQKGYHILANADGSPAAETDDSTDDKILPWDDTVLAEQELGTYTATAFGQEVTGDNRELLSRLSVGRRSFYTDKTVDHYSDCESLWNSLRRSS